MIPDIFLSTTLDLVSQFIKLRQSKKHEELESDDWKALENAYFEHLKWRFRYPKKVFTQQIATGWAISLVVIVLIISGLSFSFWQLKYALEVGDFSSLKTDVSIQTAGKISMNSSIIGAIVLVISLAFFFLYLKNVFKIQYPTPPHVGFEETDLKERIKSKLFGSEKKKESLDFNQNIYKFLINDYLRKVDTETPDKTSKEVKTEEPKIITE